MKNKIPMHISKIMFLLEDSGYKPYLVGGCVRDMIMGNVPNDYDITVNAMPEEITKLFSNNGYKTALKGQYGTVGIIIGNETIEITPHRTEGKYRDSRHPESVTFVKNIEEDLCRRDFTINALALDFYGNIVDIYNGLDDIRDATIKCIGDPKTRFNEDSLRILRAIRFASRFCFKIDKNTRNAMSECVEGLKNISAERILSEIEGILHGKGAYEALNECNDIISCIIPGFRTNAFLKKNKGDFTLKLFSCIYKNNYSNMCRICDNMKLNSNDKIKIQTMHNLFYEKLSIDNGKIIFDNKAKELLCDIKPSYIRDLFILTESSAKTLDLFLENEIYTKDKLAVSGGDIAGSGLYARNSTSKILNKVLHAVACGKIANTREAIFEYLQKFDIKSLE